MSAYKIFDHVYSGWGHYNNFDGAFATGQLAREVEQAAKQAVNNPNYENWQNLVDKMREHGRQAAGTAGGLPLDPLTGKLLGDAVNQFGGLIQDQYGGDDSLAKASKYLRESQGRDFSDAIKNLIGQEAWDALKEGTKDASNPPADRVIDPLLIDLDGDGIETNGSGVYFDHNNDGIKNRLNWASSDDGLLVIDKNNDGLITSGLELFGDDFIKADGTKAIDGFDALSSLDSNQDGVIDSNDELFSVLKIWQDLNQDGITDEGELKTLSEWGIKSISVEATNSGNQTQTGDYIVSTSSVSWEDGTTSTAYDINLNSSDLFTEFIHDTELSAEALALPEVAGMGAVDNLRYAIDKNPELKSLLSQFSAATTASEQKALMKEILAQWASTYATADDFSEVTWTSWTTTRVYDPSIGRYVERAITNNYTVDPAASAEINILALLMGNNSIRHIVGPSGAMSYLVDNIREVYAELETKVYNTLVLQTRVTKYTDLIELGLDNGSLYDFTKLEDYLSNLDLDSVDVPTVIEDLAILSASNPYGFNLDGISLFKHLTDIVEEVGINDDIKKVLDTQNISSEAYGLRFNMGVSEFISIYDSNDEPVSIESNQEVIVFGGTNSDDITVKSGQGSVFGAEGDDTLTSVGGNNLLDGGDGSDTLIGHYASNNALIGGAGDDIIRLDNTNSSTSRSYENYIEGGKGNDTITGGQSNDTYQYNLGDGHDTIQDSGSQDTLAFGEGITREMVTFVQDKDGNLILTISSGEHAGSITVFGGFINSSNRIEKIEFADGSSMGQEEILASTTKFGTSDSDTINGSSFSEIIKAGSGNDTITTQGGNDTVYGEAGDDTLTNNGYGTTVTLDGGAGNDVLRGHARGHNTLVGGAGDDVITLENDDSYRGWQSAHFSNTFNGGKGDDTLNGRYGQDSYLYNLGDGNDTITDLGGTDKIVFGEGVTQDMVSFTHDASGNIIITITDPDNASNNGSITVNHAYINSSYQMESIEFADGTTMDTEAILAAAETMFGTEGDDTLSGTRERDVIRAGSGNDTITTQGGNDTVYGEAGDDTLTNNGYGTTVTLDGGAGNDVLRGHARGHNTLVGGAGDDVITLENDDSYRGWQSAHFSNTFNGGKGDDTLNGRYGQDSYLYNLGDGNDTITDLGGTDKIVFGEGVTQDMVSFTHDASGNIIITITDPDNASNNGSITVNHAYINSSYQMESIEFADGTTMDTEAILAAAETMFGTEGDDTLSGTRERDVIRAGSGNDTITTQGGNDTVYGEAGDDTLTNNGYGTTVTLDGGAGNDVLRGHARGHNTLVGGAGDDVITLENDDSYRGWQSAHFSNTFNGGKGDDTLNGRYGQDSYLYNLGDGNDTITDLGGTDKIVFGEGVTQDMVSFTHDASGNIIITITDPDNASNNGSITVNHAYINSSYQMESIEFADGTTMDTEAILAAAETMFGTEGDDTLSGTRERDVIRAGSGNDTITTQGGNDTVYGEAGDDTLTNNGYGTTVTLDGGAGNDVLRGHARGHNTLVGGAGDDVITLENDDSYRGWQSAHFSNTFNGGKGDDTLNGRYGQDSYLYNLGDGNDTITDLGGTDKIVFGEGVTQDMVSFTHDASGNIIITITDPDNASNNGSITVNHAYINSSYQMESIEFADGTTMDTEAILAAAETMFGTEGDDTLSGTRERDVIRAGSGNDTITTQGGNDTVYGEAGDDTLTNNGYGTTVTLDGGAGNDVLRGHARGHNTLVGGAGDDVITLENDDSYRGWQSAHFSNTFNGGKGDDTLNGRYGQDSYLYNLGDGNDTITDLGGTDKIVFGEGVTQDMVSFTHDASGNIIITITDPDNASNNGSITVNHAYINSSYQMESIEFADGTTMDTEAILAAAETMFGTEGDDTLSGTRERDVIRAGSGNDTITTQGGNDTVYGEAGDDTLTNNGYGTTVTLDGGAGNDVLRGHARGHNTLVGGAGDDVITLENDDSYRGWQSAHFSNTFNGGKGDDTLNGRYGQDSYLYNLGDGNDTITDLGGTDKIVFGEGVTQDMVSFTHDASGNIIITITDPDNASNNGSITVNHAYINSSYQMESIEFADGTTMDTEAILAAAETMFGTEGDDTLSGTRERDVIRAGSGNDTITAQGGNDTVYGEAGDDTLTNNGYGTTVTLDGGAGNDVLRGHARGHNTLVGGAGDDVITLENDDSYRGWQSAHFSNTFNGGKGDDTLNGRYGQDSYLYNLGDGNDTITDLGGTDKIVFGEGVTQDMVSFTHDASGNIIITISDPDNASNNGRITINNAYVNSSYRMESIEFADGSSMDTEAILKAAETMFGTEGDDTISGTKERDVIRAGAGNDTVSTQDGNDTVYGEAGDDTLINSHYGTTVTLDGGEGNDVIQGHADANNTLIGGDGNDIITLENDGSSRYGAYSRDQKNTFSGGKGDDTLSGRYSADSYLYNLGDGNDTITDVGGTDKIVFGSDVTQDMVSFTHDASGNIIITISDPDNASNNGRITINNAYVNSSYRMESIEFADGSSMDTEAILKAAETMFGTEGDDTISGTKERDVIRAGAGNDTVSTQDGNDTVYGEAGDDTLINSHYGTTVTLDGGEGNDVIQGHADANNTLIGGDGNDIITLENDGSSRYGAYSRDQKNTFSGGKGDDTLSGRYSADSYLYNLGDGNDTITDVGGTDKIVFGSDVTQDMVSFTHDASGNIIITIQIQIMQVTWPYYHQ